MQVETRSVLLKLVYYCSVKNEVYFKRSDVTECILSDSPFTIPNKQGFDGNLSYFGHDVQTDQDGRRILLLRGQALANACLKGYVEVNVGSATSTISVESNEVEFEREFRALSSNKSREAAVFRELRQHAESFGLQVCDFRLYGNKRLFEKAGEYYIYPRVLIDPSTGKPQYELAVVEQLETYRPYIVFPLLNRESKIGSELVYSYDSIKAILNGFSNATGFSYFEATSNGVEPIDIQDQTASCIAQLVSESSYDFSDKVTTRQALANKRVNTQTFRALVLARDQSRCCLCDINDERLLVCSHIKPWSTGEDRLDMNNALTLCRMHDALFDRGFISFDDTGRLLMSDELVMLSKTLKPFLRGSANTISVNSRMTEYLKYHRKNVFIQ